MAARPTTIMTTLRTFFLSFDLAGRLISIVLLLQKFLESCNCHVERAAMRARSDWNESAKTSRTTYTVLHVGTIQGPCHQRADRLVGMEIIENKGFLPVFEV